jgi:hypothetical protein
MFIDLFMTILTLSIMCCIINIDLLIRIFVGSSRDYIF